MSIDLLKHYSCYNPTEVISMDYQKLTIGQMAKLNHISEQSLRLYDREGLLSPFVKDGSTGYRYYHIIQSARLDMIQYMKAYGMTLREIGEYLNRNNPSEIKDILKRQENYIDESIADLERSKRAVTRTLENYKRYETLPKNGLPFLEYISERKIYRYASKNNFFETDFAGYEYMLRELKEHLINSKLAMTYFCNVGTIMKKDKLLSGNFYANEVFLFIDEEIENKLEILPATTYYCLCSENFDDERENAIRLLNEIRDKGFTVNGDYVCEVIIDFPVFDVESRKMFYKIQIPVMPNS